MTAPTAHSSEPTPRLDLSRIRHDLRTPINHILGYCELLIDEGGLPSGFVSDLRRIHGGGQQMLGLIREFFDEATFGERPRDLRLLCHELRTPVNHIVGYAELLEEQAEEGGLTALLPDFRKIAEAGHQWLSLMESHLVSPVSAPPNRTGGAANAVSGSSAAPKPEPPSGAIPAPARPAAGRLLVCDDDPANRELLSRRLRRQGHEVSLCSSGGEAIGLLAAERFDLLLLDMVMPGVDGYEVLTRLKSDPALAEMPVIILSSMDQDLNVARCIEAGAEDYVVKPFNSVFLRARIGASLDRKRLRDQERQIFEALRLSQKLLSDELAEAAAYVRSLLPPPLLEGPIRADWRFLPSAQLGGDAFGYHWLDERRFAVYLLDVCGHGVGAALLSVSVLNVLRSRSSPNVDFADPEAVLGAMNLAFPMERQNNMFFTIWYGVVSVDTRELAFASGGHPPSILLGEGGDSPRELRTSGGIVGAFPEASYPAGRVLLGPGSRLYVFSDGIYELARSDGSAVQLDEFVRELALPSQGSKLDALLAWADATRAQPRFEDDVSIVEIGMP